MDKFLDRHTSIVHLSRDRSKKKIITPVLNSWNRGVGRRKSISKKRRKEYVQKNGKDLWRCYIMKIKKKAFHNMMTYFQVFNDDGVWQVVADI